MSTKLLTVETAHISTSITHFALLPTFVRFLTLPRSAAPNARRASAIKPARVHNIATKVLRSRSAAGKVQPNIYHRDICAGRHGAALQTSHSR
jgi:hypothetical protein